MKVSVVAEQKVSAGARREDLRTRKATEQQHQGVTAWRKNSYSRNDERATHTLPPHDLSMIHRISCSSCSWSTGGVPAEYNIRCSSIQPAPLSPLSHVFLLYDPPSILEHTPSVSSFLPSFLPSFLLSFIPSVAKAAHMKSSHILQNPFKPKASRGFCPK